MRVRKWVGSSFFELSPMASLAVLAWGMSAARGQKCSKVGA